MSPADAELVDAALEGRELRYGSEPPSKEVAERMLQVPTRLILEARERNPALAALDLEGALERLEHRWIGTPGERLRLEVHAGEPDAPTFVITHGLGDHARRLMPLAAALAERGYNAIAIDRRGHGLSEGRRGDATLAEDHDALDRAISIARERFGGPVILCGDSLGGIMSWYLLTREPPIAAAVCHCIGHPDVDHDLAFRVKRPAVRLLARMAPGARIPVRRIADYEHVALDPATRAYFDQELDRLFNFSITARASASYLVFSPERPWEEVTTPVLVTIGSEDRMITPHYTKRCLERAKPPNVTYLEVPGAGHQLFLDDLGLILPDLLEWVGSALERREAVTRG
jgi:lysophospholipase